MNLLSFFGFGNKKSFSGEGNGTWVTMGGAGDGINERNLLLNNKEWVFIAVDRVAKSLSGVRFKVMRYQNNRDDREVFDGPLVDFLERPAPNFTGKDFVYLNTAYKLLCGNAFWEIVSKKELRPLIPTAMTPIRENGVLIGYKYSGGNSERNISIKNILHDRYVDPSRPDWGVSKLAKIARWVDTSSFSNEFLRRFFLNGATFGGFITTEEESEERIKLIKAGLKNDHVGVENSHKMGVLPKGANYVATTKNMSEIEMGATDDRYRDKILSAFGVPKTLVGLSTDVNRATAEAAEYVYAKYTIKPDADDLVEFLNNTIAPMLDPNGRHYFAYEEFVPVNMEIELKEREIALAKQSYKTVNEVRAEIGLPPVKGGDTIYGNAMQLPLGEELEGQDSPIKPKDDEEDDEDAKEPKKAVPAHIREVNRKSRAIDSISKTITDVIIAHNDPDAEAHKSFVGRVEDHTKLVAGKVKEFNNRQERQVLLNLKQITKAVAKGDLFDMDGEISVLVSMVGPMLKGLMIEQALTEYLAQEFPGTFDTNQARITRTVELASKRLAKSYNNTTAKLLKQQLNEGIQNGDDLTQLAERVRTIYEFSDRVRAKAVAHTETFYIANEGSKEAYRQSGVVKSMRWYTAEDELVCPYCAPQNGRTVDVNGAFFAKGEEVTGSDGSSFVADYRTIDVPPLHTNCRCFIRPEVIEVN
jgi:HK97 family phage portal protein